LGARTKTEGEKMLTKKHFEKMALIILNNTSNFKNLSLKSEFKI
jgi:hypothetical protein